jgi:5'-nucleotidase
VQDPARTLRVTVNNFMATGGDRLGALTSGTHRLGGAQDIDALVRYLSATVAPNPPFDPRGPAMGEPRIVQLP